MTEHSSVAQAALRREARRRKILENSTSRLKLIERLHYSTDKNSSETCLKRESQAEVGVPESSNLKDNHRSEILKPLINSKLSEMLKENKDLKEISDCLLSKNLEEELDEVEEEEISTDVTHYTLKYYLLLLCNKKLHYVFLALLVNVLFYLDYGYLFYENIFCPFYSVKIIELIARKEEKQDMQPILFLFLAGLPKSVQKITKFIFYVLAAIFSDLLLYLFMFVIGTKMINIQV